MLRTHIACHLPAALEVAPGRERFEHAIGFIFPDESIGAIGSFFTHRRRIEEDFDRVVEKVDGFVGIGQSS